MAESPTFTNEMIDSAWQEAMYANNAFDQYKLAEMRLQRVHEVASFAIEGIVIKGKVFATLEKELADARAEYGRYHPILPPAPTLDSLHRNNEEQVDGPAIAHVTYAEQSLTVIEQIIGHDNHLVCDKDELYAFAESRGYDKGIATRAYSILVRTGRSIRVNELSDYNPPSDPAAKDFGGLRTIVYGVRQERKYALDKLGILYTTCKWIDAKPDIKNLGFTVISFLADYCNQAFPELEKGALPVTHPPKPKRDTEARAAAESARLRELDLKDLLLDKVNLHGEGEKWVVTDHSLKRHALSLGYAANSAPKYARLLQTIKARLAPETHPSSHEPYNVNDWLVYTGRHFTGTPWGILPDAFKDIIGDFEAITESGKHIEYYSDLTRGVLKQYLEALEVVMR
ncbi:MAG TPA: hypothetical protein VLG16_04480 [Candidatus Saccharimonadales bacterium]|nr:hypothetical protein [Candidatus Saccharimonadales bacterium]